MNIRVGASSDIGQVREGNEDSYLVQDPLYAVADGMGGHRGGEVASNLALQTIQDLFAARQGSLTEQVEEANRAVFERSRSDRDVAGMGTTLTAALVQGAQVRLAHVGDSRAYLFRGGELSLLTEDHTLVHKMLVEGEISETEAETHPHRSILTRALGVDGRVQVDEGIVEMRGGDRLLLCTDGLTGMVSDEQITAVLKEANDPQEAVDRLVRAANRAGGIDNITAVIIDFVEDGAPTDGTRDVAVPHQPTREQPVPPTGPPPERSDITIVGRPIPEAPTPEDATGPVPRAGATRRTEGRPASARGAERRPAERPAGERRPSERPPKRRRGLRRAGVGIGVLLVVAVLGAVGLRLYLDTQWFVGVSNGRVAIFRGVPAQVGAFELHSVVLETSIPAGDAQALAVWRDLPDGITADDRDAAEAIVDQIRRDVAGAQPDRS